MIFVVIPRAISTTIQYCCVCVCSGALWISVFFCLVWANKAIIKIKHTRIKIPFDYFQVNRLVMTVFARRKPAVQYSIAQAIEMLSLQCDARMSFRFRLFYHISNRSKRVLIANGTQNDISMLF